MDGEDGKKKEVLGEHESIMTLKKDPTMICTRGTSPVFVQNVCFTVQSLTTNPLPSDLLNSITSMMSRGGYVPSILICHLWIHLLRSLPLPKFESLFPHMFTTSEALKGGRELAELVRTTCNNEDVWSVKEMDDGFKVDVEILSTDVPGTEGREVCFEALAVKKLLYSLFIRGLDADFQREGAYNGKKVSMRWIDSDYGSKFAVVRVVYSALSNTSIVENTPVPDLTLQKMAVAI
ncbi:hypothetical protein BC829DRAFT_405844 [Chytridium lagenaria]|nr:hypothetical protein BC829DRAFT_405844 [Chytridium lagenaria]